MADGQVDPLDEGGLDETGQTHRLELFDQGFALPPEHTGDGIGQLATAFAFDQLTLEEVFIHLPVNGLHTGSTGTGRRSRFMSGSFCDRMGWAHHTSRFSYVKMGGAELSTVPEGCTSRDVF